ncbi:hypothetical protein IAQ61_003276 [Plenodomus lingam]|uniref:uncharacterized protein n=1 Tax=Leptosphaeria maculans TaxID=5022 RepID=UPI00331CE2FF|nr:hypothetical protein IAQ61_003276 [Plenodomus lingam]
MHIFFYLSTLLVATPLVSAAPPPTARGSPPDANPYTNCQPCPFSIGRCYLVQNGKTTCQKGIHRYNYIVANTHCCLEGWRNDCASACVG